MKISIEAKGLDELQNKLKFIASKASDTEPLMAELANHLYNISFNSLRDEASPDGISWSPLKASTLKSKKRNHDSILYEEGDLRESLTADSSKTQARVGLNATKGGYPYPIVHQFGTSIAGRSNNTTIEARPFMPIHDDETLYDNVKMELEEIVEDYMKEGSSLK